MNCPYCGSTFTIDLNSYPNGDTNKKIKIKRCLNCQSNIVIEHEKYEILK